MHSGLDSALQSIPDGLRKPLLQFYAEALQAYRAGQWEGVGLKAGKIAETVYTIASGKVAGGYSAQPSKPSNMVAACLALEQHNKTHGRSLCIQIPRLLTAIYELRNNRAIGHVGGDVDPNHMDAEFFLQAIKWLISELVRVFANLPVDQARELVEAVTARTLHVVWSNGDTKRVLNTNLSAKQKVLVLAYASDGRASVPDLVRWADYSNASRLRSDVLWDLHKDALIHFDREADVVALTPLGFDHVEANNLLAM